MAVDSVLLSSAMAYKLVGDGATLCLSRNPRFLTQTRLAVDITTPLVALYSDCLRLRKGVLPYQSGALVGLNYQLQEVFRYSWRQGIVDLICVPAADLSSSKSLVFTAQLDLPGILLGELPVAAASSKVPPLGQVQPVPAFTFRFRITGLEDASWLIAKVGSFNVGLDMPGDVVVTIPHDGSSGPFRNWLQGGNDPRTGTLEFLAADLSSVILKFQFSGLRIRSIDPTYSTFSSNPAKIQLSYGGVSLAPA